MEFKTLVRKWEKAARAVLRTCWNSQYAKPAALTVLLAVIYSPTIGWMVDRWMAKDSYFSHGFLVPVVSLYIVWLKRRKLKAIKPRSVSWGLALIVGGLLIHVLSAFLRVYFTSAYSFLPVLCGLILYFRGLPTLKELWFPVTFLVFMIPLPLIAIVGITFKMKIFAAYWANKIVNAMGIRAVLEGSIIKMRHTHVVVEDVCSGLRSLISLLALGALMAYFSNLPRYKKLIVFLSAGAMAILANIVRIVFMAVTSEVYGAKFTEGFLHTLSGLIVFVVAFAGLMIVVKELE
ncbi:MAG: exosortase [Candidatus Omnitrophica bacterium]|nr:exosortase [Candidatus Omnitrophota bacterium]